MSSLKLHITISGANNPVAVMATQKFNKLGWVSQEFDDGSFGAVIAKNLFANLFYTDGCGNNIPYKAAIGLNAGTGVAGSTSYNPAYIQASELRSLIDAGFDVDNHSMYHRSGFPLDDTVALDDVIALQVLYKPTTLIIPTDYLGYTDAAKLVGYKSSSGQGAATFDSLAPGINSMIPNQLGPLPEFFGLSRDFNDDWVTAGARDGFKAHVDELISGVRNFYVLGTHSPLDTPEMVTGFTDFYNYVHSQSNDRLLVCSTREALEYRSMRGCPMMQSVVGNVLTVEFDTTALPNRTRFRDVSLNITGGMITGVSSEGFTNVGYNLETGLVNGFLERKVWGASSGEVVPDPNQIIKVKRGRFYAV